MLKTEKDKRICAKYSARDSKGNVHCIECPLVVVGEADCMCKANSHYNRHTRMWELDEVEE